MITSTKSKPMAFNPADSWTPKCYFELSGLSSDAKPTTFEGAAVANVSIFLEMDTSKVYIYDEAGETWREL